MRNQIDTAVLQNLRAASNLSRQVWTNTKGERFMYEDNHLIEYTDTRVIDHDTDRLVDLSTEPFTDS